MSDIKYPIIDVEATLDAQGRQAAIAANAEAVVAEIEARQYELLLERHPGDAGLTSHLDTLHTVAARRRDRADRMAKRYKVSASDLDIRIDMALQLDQAQQSLAWVAEQYNNMDLYVAPLDDQVAPHANINGMVAQPLSEAQITANYDQAVTREQALQEWLEAHHSQGGTIADLGANNPGQSAGVAAFKKWLTATGNDHDPNTPAHDPTADQQPVDPGTPGPTGP